MSWCRMLVPNLQSVVCSKRAPHSLMCSPAAGAMAGMRTNIQLSPSFRVLLLFTRSKTTRPQEWKDRSQFVAKVHPDQRREEETRNSRRHKWMDVRWKNKNTAETMIHSLAIDESRRSDPKEAKKISDAKILALRNSLSSKGYVSCRTQPVLIVVVAGFVASRKHTIHQTTLKKNYKMLFR